MDSHIRDTLGREVIARTNGTGSSQIRISVYDPTGFIHPTGITLNLADAKRLRDELDAEIAFVEGR